MIHDEKAAITNSEISKPPLDGVKILLAALYWDYGKQDRGLSYEYYNFYLPLREIFAAECFEIDRSINQHGKQGMNEQLLARVKECRPDIALFALFQDEFLPDVIEQIRHYTTTVAYFFDDMWRTDYAQFWAPRFDYITTSSSTCMRRYRDKGYEHVIYSPFGFNQLIFKRKNLPKLFDVSFVGGFHGHRDWTVRQIRRAGINVAVWGMGWPTGRLMQEAMVDVLNQSKISLTLSNCLSWDVRYLLGSPRWALSDLRRCRKWKEQLKARHFEVNGCGTFQMSYYVEDLEHCYEIGREIVVYNDVDDLIEKIRYYLKYEDERDAIAAAGYRRAISEHTYAARFKEIVNRVFADRGV